MKTLLIAAAFALAASPVLATEVPSSSKYDSRIQYVNYNDGDVVLVRALPGIGSRIVFAPGEKVIDIASGFTAGWKLKASHNILYLKPQSVKVGNGGQGTAAYLQPKAGKWDTNLMVRTNRHLYDFYLKLMPGSSSAAPSRNQRVAYRVQFRYPAAEKAREAAAARRQIAKRRMDAEPSPVNWNYTMQVGDNSTDIAPTMAYDDGRFTYLRFPGNRDFPAAFLVSADGQESIVNSHVDPDHPDILVLHRVAKQIVLRLGKEVVGVYNEAFDPMGVPARTGTTVPGVKRTIKTSASE